MLRKRSSRGENGQGMVEFAIVFPLIVILILAIFEFGRVMFAYSISIAAAREAARYGAAIQDIGGGIPQYEDCQGIRDAAKRVGKFAGISDADITIKYSDDAGVYSAVCPPSQEVGLTDYISVTINTSVKPITPMGSFDSIPIASSSSRTILNKIRLGESDMGVGSIAGLASDVNFTTTSQTAEESRGTVVAILELNSVATELVTIPFSTTGTAVEGVDYSITASPVTISPGNTTTTLFITLVNDAIEEGDESLFIGINSPTNATKGPQNIHMVKIVDPPFISFTIADSTKLESDLITALNIELSKGSTQDVTVPIVSGGTATWGDGADYQTTPNPIVIPAGSLTSLLTITINDDLIDEDDEIAAIAFGAPINAVLGAIPMHLMTIVDNDDPPEVMFFSPYQVVSEEIGTFTTQVTLSEVAGKAVLVPYTISGTTIPADYAIHNLSPLVIPPGVQTVGINMDILEGDGWEVDETLILTLGTPQNAVLGSPDKQTIVITESSSEPLVSFAAGSQSVSEGDTVIDVYVEMSNAWSSDVAIQFAISGTAIEGLDQDYELSDTSLTIPVGFTQGSFQVQMNDDTLDEVDESIEISIDAIINGFVTTPSIHTITIVDDDSAPEVNFSTTQIDKLESAGQFSINVRLESTTTQDVTIPLLFAGSATNGSDYAVSTASLVILSGSSSNSFNINIIDDTQVESDEIIYIDLGEPTNAVLGSDTRFTVNIEDNELPLCDVGTHMLTISTDGFSWSVTNEGEELIFTGGSVTWIDTGGLKPRLNEIQFSGTPVFSGEAKAPNYSYSAWESFAELDTTSIQFSFDGIIGVGQHILVGEFQNASSGTTCSLTETFQTH
ncbi:MAG: pilus assembly protein [Anaerolineales bacterium]|nr:pilus assembly protein [Anaerolineales bacterium]